MLKSKTNNTSRIKIELARWFMAFAGGMYLAIILVPITNGEPLTFFVVLIAGTFFFASIGNRLAHQTATFLVALVLWILLGGMSFTFIQVMLDNDFHTLIMERLGTAEKKDTLTFIGLGMGGTLAAINAIAMNRRANAQERNNKLVEKGHDNNRFQNLVRDLGHGRTTVRTAAFHRFYYLAVKDIQTDKFREDVFEILCSYLCIALNKASGDEKENVEYQAECQTLFDILFKGKFKSNSKKCLMRHNFEVNLQKAFLNLKDIDISHSNLAYTNLSGANLSCKDLSGVDFSEANLQGAKLDNIELRNVRSINKADFRGAMIGNKRITREHCAEHFPHNKGEYYTDWNPPIKQKKSLTRLVIIRIIRRTRRAAGYMTCLCIMFLRRYFIRHITYFWRYIMIRIISPKVPYFRGDSHGK